MWKSAKSDQYTQFTPREIAWLLCYLDMEIGLYISDKLPPSFGLGKLEKVDPKILFLTAIRATEQLTSPNPSMHVGTDAILYEMWRQSLVYVKDRESSLQTYPTSSEETREFTKQCLIPLNAILHKANQPVVNNTSMISEQIWMTALTTLLHVQKQLPAPKVVPSRLEWLDANNLLTGMYDWAEKSDTLLPKDFPFSPLTPKLAEMDF